MSFSTVTAFVILLGVVAALAALPPQTALAQSTSPSFRGGFETVEKTGEAAGVKKFDSVGDFIIAVLKVVAALVAVLALGALIIGAAMYIISLGDESKTERAKKIIMYAVIGLVLLGAAGIIVNVAINLIRAT